MPLAYVMRNAVYSITKHKGIQQSTIINKNGIRQISQLKVKNIQ